MKKRLIEFLSYLGIGQTKFEETAGLPRGYVNKMSDNTRTTSLQKITDRYPELNINWLKTGEGEMLKSGTVQTARDIKVSGDNSGVVGHVGGNVSMGDRALAEENKRLTDENCRLHEENSKLFDRLMAANERIGTLTDTLLKKIQ